MPEPQGGLAGRAMGSAVWLFSGSILRTLLRFAVLAVLARLLGPLEFGLAAAAMVAINLFRILLQTGVRPAVIQRPEMGTLHVETAFTLALGIGALAGGGIAWASGWIARDVFAMPELEGVLRVMALMLPIQSAGVVAGGLLERELSFPTLVRIDLSAYFLGYGAVGIPMALAGHGVWALVGAYLSQELLVAVARLVAQPHPKRLRLEVGATREILYFGTGFTVARLGNFGALNGDKWVAGRWLGQDALGFYKFAFEMTQMVGALFGGIFDKALFPAMSRVQEDREQLAVAYRRGVAMTAVLVLPTSALLFTLAPEIIQVVLGPAWQPVVAPFRVLALALIFRATSSLSDSLARATGSVVERAWRQALYAAAVIGSAWLGQRWGLATLALGVVAGVVLNFLLMTQLSVRLTGLRWRELLPAHLGALPAFALPLGLAWGAAGWARARGFDDWLVLGGTTAATGLAMLLALAFAPRLMLGAEGLASVRMMIDFADSRIPGLARWPVLRAIGR